VSFSVQELIIPQAVDENGEEVFEEPKMDLNGDRPSFLVGESGADEASDDFPPAVENGVKPSSYELSLADKRRRLR
jgi:hypothetical protein